MTAASGTTKAAKPPIRNDWVSKSLAGTLLGLALGLGAGGILNQLTMPVPFASRLQLVMWIVPPVWMSVLGGVYFFRSGARAWAWLGAATAVTYGIMLALRYLIPSGP